MTIALQTVFWLAALGILHSYIFYPVLLRWLARNKVNNSIVFSKRDEWPTVSVLMAAYNEEQVIGEKMESLVSLNYPVERTTVWVGSDCSSDGTNPLVDAYTQQYPRVHFFPFQKRRGKPGVINELFEAAVRANGLGAHHIIVITDASVMLTEQALTQLVKHFKNPAIGLVDGLIVHTGLRQSGISKAEDHYIFREAMLKHREGLVWGKMVGPFGGCYALRSDYFSEVPANYLVDDFYIAMRVLERGGQAISELEAVCHEGVSHDIREEYRRKARISAGNFQNLSTFPHLWWPPVGALRFAFFSHKVLRWLGPFLLIVMLTAALLLTLAGNLFYTLLLCLLVGILILPILLDTGLKKLDWHFTLLRKARYFTVMNVALLEGFYKYIKGIRSNAWEPTKRN